MNGAAHWGNKPIRSDALDVKFASFSEQASFEKYVCAQCHYDLVEVVKSLQALFWQPDYQKSIKVKQFHIAL